MVPIPTIGAHIFPEVILTADQESFEIFPKMKPPNFRVVRVRMFISS